MALGSGLLLVPVGEDGGGLLGSERECGEGEEEKSGAGGVPSGGHRSSQFRGLLRVVCCIGGRGGNLGNKVGWFRLFHVEQFECSTWNTFGMAWQMCCREWT